LLPHDRGERRPDKIPLPDYGGDRRSDEIQADIVSLKYGNSRTTFVTPKLVEAKTGAPEQLPKQYPSRSM
jgi:hypothetical protein